MTPQAAWLLAVALLGAPLVVRTLYHALHGRFATDVVASMSIIAAIVLRQPLVAFVIIVMQAGGEALERHAAGRARRAVAALERAAPRRAHRLRDGVATEVPVGEILVGDALLVRPGDILPCDGEVTDGDSELDTSSLTGESRPRPASPGIAVMSGMVNLRGSFTMRVSALAAASQYARIVELVRGAQESKAPIQRLADRYATWFTPFTIALCMLTFALTRDWLRVLAILVVATPCPLILAAPVAMIGGINRAAQRLVIMRTGAALESLSRVDTVVLDKTGTITTGQPTLLRVLPAPGRSAREVLRLAAAVEQHSSHQLARVIVASAAAEGDAALAASRLNEAPGQGIRGYAGGLDVAVGSRAFVIPLCDDGEREARELEPADASLLAYVAVDGHLAAVIEFDEAIRPDLPGLLRRFAARGTRVLMLSGDHAPRTRKLATQVGIAEAHGGLLPGEKLAFVRQLRAEGRIVMMVGDGVNDAPALAEADVGVALGGHGGGITCESADVILLDDSLGRVGEAIEIGQRTVRIARQSIWVGLSLSGVGMLAAALGAITPLFGAAAQEVIDVAVILNALRSALAPASPGQPSLRLQQPEPEAELHVVRSV